ncbi:MAG: hypothetical protein AAF432_15110, partial [Planctomycetota bacterium]
MANMWQSSNPALSDMETFRDAYGVDGAKSQYATMQGVVNKTFFLVALTTIAGIGGYQLVEYFPGIAMVSGIAAFITALA